MYVLTCTYQDDHVYVKGEPRCCGTASNTTWLNTCQVFKAASGRLRLKHWGEVKVEEEMLFSMEAQPCQTLYRHRQTARVSRWWAISGAVLLFHVAWQLQLDRNKEVRRDRNQGEQTGAKRFWGEEGRGHVRAKSVRIVWPSGPMVAITKPGTRNSVRFWKSCPSCAASSAVV